MNRCKPYCQWLGHQERVEHPYDAIPGVTLSLLKSGETTVNATPTTRPFKIRSVRCIAIQRFQQYVASQSAVNNRQAGPLANDPAVRQIMNDLRSRNEFKRSGQYQYLSQIGVQFTATGTVTFNQSSLASALYHPLMSKLYSGPGGNNGLFNNFLQPCRQMTRLGFDL